MRYGPTSRSADWGWRRQDVKVVPNRRTVAGAAAESSGAAWGSGRDRVDHPINDPVQVPLVAYSREDQQSEDDRAVDADRDHVGHEEGGGIPRRPPGPSEEAPLDAPADRTTSAGPARAGRRGPRTSDPQPPPGEAGEDRPGGGRKRPTPGRSPRPASASPPPCPRGPHPRGRPPRCNRWPGPRWGVSPRDPPSPTAGSWAPAPGALPGRRRGGRGPA